MDKVKLYGGMLVKHHFWVLSVVVAAAGIVAWWMGSSSLAKETDTNRSTLNSAYTNAQSVASSAKNASFAEAVLAEQEKLKADVFARWKEQYGEQQKLFQWPETVKDIGDLPPGRPLSRAQQVEYKRIVPIELEKLTHERAQIRNPIPDPTVPQSASAIGQAASYLDGKHFMFWGEVGQEASQQELWNRYRSRFATTDTPSRTRVEVTQEDLWVIGQLLDVIAKTNEGFTDQANAAVKLIHEVDVAQWALAKAQQSDPMIFYPTAADAATGDAGGMGMGGAGGMEGGMGGEGDQPMTPEAREEAFDKALLKHRYVDDKGKPLEADDPAAPTPGPFAEFKQLFVRIKLRIDERRLPRLLANCANSPLPIEVWRTSFVANDFSPQSPGGGMGSGGFAGGGMGMGSRGMGSGGMGSGGLGAMGMGAMGSGGFGRGGMGEDMERGYGPPGGAMGSRGFGGMGSGGMGSRGFGGPGIGGIGAQPGMVDAQGNPIEIVDGTLEATPLDADVEICGIVRIYHRPDPAKLGTGTAIAAGSADATATAPVDPGLTGAPVAVAAAPAATIPGIPKDVPVVVPDGGVGGMGGGFGGGFGGGMGSRGYGGGMGGGKE